MSWIHVKRARRFLWAILLLAVLAGAALVLALTGRLNGIFIRFYPVRGVDVSHHQGDIDWTALREEGAAFAYIKATEGSGHVDERFADNWREAKEAGILCGAYHFFSFDSEPETQAALFIQTVGPLSGHLIPVLDVEYYGDKRADPPKKDEAAANIREMLGLLEEQYSARPMIYTTYPFYQRYLQGEFEDYPLWIRNTYFPPFDKGTRWTFWQYTDQAGLPGSAEGAEIYVDWNVFRGTKEELGEFVAP